MWWHRDVGDARGGSVALGRSPRTRGKVVDEDLEIAARGKFIEVVPGDVGMQREVLRDLTCRHAVAVASKQVDLSSGRITESCGDRFHGSGKRPVVALVSA